MSDPTQLRDLLPPDVLSDEHLLVALTGSSAVRDLAGRESLVELAGQTPAELQAAGLTANQAHRVAAAFELGRRLSTVRLELGVQLRTPKQIFDAYDGRLRDEKKEHFLAILLDARKRVLREETVSIGILTASLVHPREVFAPAIRHAAASVALLHNHPSQDPTESPEDVEIFRRLVAVGQLIGIHIEDFVILGGGKYVSFRDRGLLP